jgi:GWxTD domain-containing protein
MARTATAMGLALALLSAASGFAVAEAGAGAAAGLAAEPQPQNPSRASLEEFPKVDPKTLDEKYRVFLDEVNVILTEAEEDAFLRMESDTQRDAFIERFWLARDPSVGTPQNEYKDEYYRRLEYVEKHYGRGTPRQGWQTDQGRMYLLLGEPMNVKTMPWTQQAYPAELWWYHANPRLGIPPFFYLIFFKRNGVGEFVLYSPLVDGPKALLNPAGTQAMRQLQNEEFGRPATIEGEAGAAYDVLVGVDAELAQASFSLIPGDYGAQMGYASMRSQMMMGDIESIPEKIMPTASWAYPILTGVVEADVRFETLPINTMAVPLLDPSGIPFLHFGVMTEGGRLNLNSYEGRWYLTFEVAGSLVDDQNRVIAGLRGADASSTKILQADLEEAEARRLRSGPLVYLDRLPIVGGVFDFDLILENNVSREFGRSEVRVEVPAPWPADLRSSPPVLAWAVFENPNHDPYSEHYPFQVGPYSIVPAMNNSFSIDDGLMVFQQVYLPPGHSGRLTATYALSAGGEAILERTEYVDPATADRSGTINHVTMLDLEGIAPGDYELVVDLEGDDRGPASFDVALEDRGPEAWAPYLHMNLGPPPTDPGFAHQRAEQLRMLGQIEEAIEVLSSAVSRVDDPEILDLQVALMMEAGRYAEVAELLRPRLIQRPNDVGLLQTMAEVSSQMGRNADAIMYYERIRLVEADERTTILNPLASSYFGDGRNDKAREMLELSLQLEPNQPEIRRLLEQILRR